MVISSFKPLLALQLTEKADSKICGYGLSLT